RPELRRLDPTRDRGQSLRAQATNPDAGEKLDATLRRGEANAARRAGARITLDEAAARGLRRRAGLPGNLALAQLEAVVDRRTEQTCRPRRLLDVLVHQLPAHASAPRAVGSRVPVERAGDRRCPHA